MNLIISLIYGLTGAIVGYKLPAISLKIIQLKKSKYEVNNNSLTYSKLLVFCLCLFNGLAWGLTGFFVERDLLALIIVILITIGLIIAYIDINIRIIPNELVLTIIILGILFQVIYFGTKSLIGAFASMIVMMIIFTTVAGFIGFGKVGAGDVKLAGAMGLTLGYPLVITAVGIMSIILLIFILIGLTFKKIYLSTMIPMAPFMIVGFIFGLMTFII